MCKQITQGVVAIKLGSRVKLKGLSKAELNGQHGRVNGKQTESGRWPVLLPQLDFKVVSVKPENLDATGLHEPIDQTPSGAAGHVSTALPEFPWDKQGHCGRGTLVESFEGMFSVNEKLAANGGGFDLRSGDESAELFFEAKQSLHIIATHFQNGGHRLLLCKTTDDTEGVVIKIDDTVRTLSNGYGTKHVNAHGLVGCA